MWANWEKHTHTHFHTSRAEEIPFFSPHHTNNRADLCSHSKPAQRARYNIPETTLQEKTLHIVFKNFVEGNPSFHEIRVGSYVADIKNDWGIIEIQTAQFNRMREKLKAFLPDHRVMIVHPIPHIKWLNWFDPDTGQVSGKRKSPKKGSFYHIFPELYKIKSFLNDSNLSFMICLVNVEEYRLLNGWSKDKKKGSCRYERLPLDFEDLYTLDNSEDYYYFIPEQIRKEEYTSADFAKAAKIRRGLAQITLNILLEVGAVERLGKKGRAYLYQTKK